MTIDLDLTLNDRPGHLRHTRISTLAHTSTLTHAPTRVAHHPAHHRATHLIRLMQLAVVPKILLGKRCRGGLDSSWIAIYRGVMGVYTRWIIECTHHDGCFKKRSSVRTETFGNIEPIAYLTAWNRKGADISKEAHVDRKLKITPEMVARAVVWLGDRATFLLSDLCSSSRIWKREERSFSNTTHM